MPDTRLFSDAKEIQGYLNAGDDRTGKPTVVLIHEWWGLNDQVRGTADRLAKEGFVVFAPDLFRGQTAEIDKEKEKAAKLAQSLDWSGAEMELRAMANALRHRDPNSKLGVMGFCIGGSLALMAGTKIPLYDAIVSYYGVPDASRADVSKIKGRVQGHYGRQDQSITEEKVRTLEQSLEGGNVRFEIHRYDAGHAFANEKRPEMYSEANAKLAWERTIKFLHDALG
jgi:carboxymethylenebutenolidase